MAEPRRRRAQEGFTLIEVMVVVLVLGVLIMIGLPTFLGAKLRAEERRAQESLRTGQTTGLTYWTEGGTYTALDTGCTATTDSCSRADSIEASVDWVGPGQPSGHQVSLVIAAGNSMLLVATTPSGEFFCLAQSTSAASRGHAGSFASIDTMPECAGGW